MLILVSMDEVGGQEYFSGYLAIIIVDEQEDLDGNAPHYKPPMTKMNINVVKAFSIKA